jgi:hypothetical protein
MPAFNRVRDSPKNSTSPVQFDPSGKANNPRRPIPRLLAASNQALLRNGLDKIDFNRNSELLHVFPDRPALLLPKHAISAGKILLKRKAPRGEFLAEIFQAIHVVFGSVLDLHPSVVHRAVLDLAPAGCDHQPDGLSALRDGGLHFHHGYLHEIRAIRRYRRERAQEGHRRDQGRRGGANRQHDEEHGLAGQGEVGDGQLGLLGRRWRRRKARTCRCGHFAGHSEQRRRHAQGPRQGRRIGRR